MKKRLAFLQSIAFYPFAIAAYPILALLAHNIEYVNADDIVRPLGIAWGSTLALLIILRILLKDIHKAALICAVVVLLFFSYGHIYLFLKANVFPLARHRLLVFVWLLVIGLSYWLAKTKISISPKKASEFFNGVTFFLLIFPIFQILSFHYPTWAAQIQTKKEDVPGIAIGENAPPDIYYIVLDAHTRADVLKEHYNYDNNAFIESLTALGFYVAHCSQSNYTATNLSLTSTLNTNYIENVQAKRTPLPAWNQTIVRQTLDSFDYTIVTFDNKYARTPGLDADIFLSLTANTRRDNRFLSVLTEFEAMLIHTSAGLLLTESESLFPGVHKLDTEDILLQEHYRRTMFILDELEKTSAIESPKFVMAHLLVPHEPFVFGSRGGFHIEPDKKLGYVNQIEFIDTRILSVLKSILKQSATPPIIILQGDHGPPFSVTPEMRSKILNAYHLPEGGNELLYESITPVNSFRIVFNRYFGGQYNLLEDVAYYILKDAQDYLKVVPNTCQP